MERTVGGSSMNLVAGDQPVVGSFILRYDEASSSAGPAAENDWKDFHQLPPR